jgi:hypothetical protein
MKAVFLDFDGVIVDSVRECYMVSRDVYFDSAPEGSNTSKHEELFFQFRGLVKPAHEFLILHQAIDSFLSGNSLQVPALFEEKKKASSAENNETFEKLFFARREIYQRDLETWLKMNPLTNYGKYLQGKKLKNYHIVTTKNLKSVELLLNYHGIVIEKIYDKEHCKIPGGKGSVILEIMKNFSLETGIFVDDVVGHLETVKDERVKCYFADWGYGKNKNYPVFNKELWEIDL